MPPPPVEPAFQTATISFTPTQVAPGGEIFKCQNFENPFGFTDVEILRSESFMTTGSHHMFVFYQDNSFNGGVEDCSGLEFGQTIHSAARPQQINDYPDGVGRRIVGSQGLRVLVHYLNTTPTTQTMEINVTFDYVPPGSITGVAGSVFANQPFINVPPRSPGSAGGSCGVPMDVFLLGGVSHMHQYGTHFIANTNTGVELYQGTEWNEPTPRAFDPPLFLGAGTRIDYSCQYNNHSAQTLTFGDSAQFNEMCIFAGTYYTEGGDGRSISCALGF